MPASTFFNRLKRSLSYGIINAVLVTAAFINAGKLNGESLLQNIQQTPLVFSNHDKKNNTLNESALELLHQAESSILIICFSLTDQALIQILNQKASQGIDVHLVVDPDHLSLLKSVLDPAIKIGTRQHGEGHVHHKILVVDSAYIWLGSANFTQNSLSLFKNLAIACYNQEIGRQLHQEAFHIQSEGLRVGITPLFCYFGNQLLELYILPHNQPERPNMVEYGMNEIAKQKLISLLDNAQHHINISIDAITFKDASRALIRAHKRGVIVQVFTSQLKEDAVKLLLQEGVNVKLGDKIHHKFVLIDHKILLNGSPNFSMNAFSRSDESFIVLNDISTDQLAVMNAVWISISGKGLDLNEFQTILDDSLPVYDNSLDGIDNSFKDEIAEKATLVHRTISNINAAIQNACIHEQEEKRLVTIGKKLSYKLSQFIPFLKTASVPGCCLYSGENYLTNVVAIAEKQERVEDAIKQMKTMTGVDEKVCDYFQKTLGKLKQGINVPLPDFFHATTNGLNYILETKMIKQSTHGAAGSGTYMSCNNEGHFGYGPFAFAIDEGILVNTEALIFTGRQPNGDVYYSLWASVLKDIPISEKTIAYIDVATHFADIEHVKALVKTQNVDIEVIERSTSDSIREIFDLSTKRRETPSFHWSKQNTDDYLPQNMYLRSEQGTFRRFMPGI